MVYKEWVKQDPIVCVWTGMQPWKSGHCPFLFFWVLAPSLLRDVGRASTNGLQLFVYMQFVGRLASFPLLKEAIYNSIHVYLLHCFTLRTSPPLSPGRASIKWCKRYVQGSAQPLSLHLIVIAPVQQHWQNETWRVSLVAPQLNMH